MKPRIASPFVHHEGRWYVIENWLRSTPQKTRLRIRMLTPAETRLLRQYRESFDYEVWAMVMGRRKKSKN